MQFTLSIEQRSKSELFRALHQDKEIFVMPCAWDSLSAMVFEELGFSCVGTTSGGVNWSWGKRDYVYSVPREEMLKQYAEITKATSLPVSADLENGYGDSARDVAETVKQSILSGMVGGSIEDQNTVPGDNLIDIELCLDRIIAARETANGLDPTYTLTARCEVFSTNSNNPYGKAVERLNRYYSTGANCLFVPGISDTQTLAQLVRDVDGTISFGMGASKQPIES